MKKVFVVSKTHLDLGFTDYAKNVLDKYLTQYIPNAIKTANEVNTDDCKKFVWTTGSWLLKKALEQDKDNLVRDALKNGNIAPHALPFTMHTELLDLDSLDYALSIVDELDEIIGTKTVAAKMTDVPGHTISLVPVLAKHGIKLLHIGVNGASAMPNVPECFLWRHSDSSEVVVIYSGSYGGAFKCDLIDEVLYFDHTVDNRGARNKKDTIAAFEKIKEKYPDYDVQAGRMDDYAEAIWRVRDKLPVVTSEIGDTWIHGLGTDPYKVGAVKELMLAKNEIQDRNSLEFHKLMEAILCVAEHTWGGDSKVFLSDYCHYDKEGFKKARELDNPKLTPRVLASKYGADVTLKRLSGEYNKGSYRAIEKCWQEQRDYISAGVSALPNDLREKTLEKIDELKPNELIDVKPTCVNELVSGDIRIAADDSGNTNIYYKNKIVFDSRGRAPITYFAFSGDDYDCWLDNYTRDFDDNHLWSFPDFCRPFLHDVDGKYALGSYSPKCESVTCDASTLSLIFTADAEHSDKLGCPRKIQVCYSIADDKVSVKVLWLDKDASRIPEATIFSLYPASVSNLMAQKCGRMVDVSDIVEYGSRRLFATEKMTFTVDDNKTQIINRHSPLCIPGMCNLVQFSNNYPNPNEDGISFVLHDSVWGTNFPLWYEDNASFEFDVKIGE